MSLSKYSFALLLLVVLIFLVASSFSKAEEAKQEARKAAKDKTKTEKSNKFQAFSAAPTPLATTPSNSWYAEISTQHQDSSRRFEFSSDSEKEVQFISSALNELHRQAVSSSNNNNTASPPKAVSLSLIVASASPPKSDMKTVSRLFVEEVIMRQKLSSQSQKQKGDVLNLILFLFVGEKDNNNKNSKLAALFQKRGPIFYTMLAANEKQKEDFLLFPPKVSKSNNNKNKPEHPFSVFHQYEGDSKSSYAFHQFFSSLRDLAPIVLAEQSPSGCAQLCAETRRQERKERLEIVSGGGDPLRLESFLEKEPDEVNEEEMPDDPMMCREEIFKSIKGFTSFSPLSAASSSSSSKTISSDVLLRRVEHVSDIIRARDGSSSSSSSSPKRVVFVINSAAAVRPQTEFQELLKYGKFSNPLLASASQGRVLYLWYSWSNLDMESENERISQRREILGKKKKKFEEDFSPSNSDGQKRRGAITVEEAEKERNEREEARLKRLEELESEESEIHSIQRVNNSLWNFRDMFSNDFDFRPFVFVLSDAIVDDGLVRFRENFSSSSSSSPFSSLSSAYDVEDEVKKASIADLYSQAAVQQKEMEMDLEPTTKEESEQEKKQKVEQLLSRNNNVGGGGDDLLQVLREASSSNLLLDQRTPNQFVSFVRRYANPGLFQPFSPTERNQLMRSFRYVALIFVKTIGFDKEYNSRLAQSILEDDLLQEDLKKNGQRTGKLVPFATVMRTSGAATRGVEGFTSGGLVSRKREHLVPFFILNSVLHGDLAVELSVSQIQPCFVIYDRRDRRVITDRREFVPERGDQEMLKLAILSVWKRAQLLPGSALLNFQRDKLQRERRKASEERDRQNGEEAESNNNNKKKTQRSYLKLEETPIEEEATTLPGKVMEWIEETVPYFRRTRLWLRVDPETMLFSIGAVLLAFIVFVVLIFLAYLIKLPTENFEKLVYGTEEEKEKMKQKIATAAKIRQEIKGGGSASAAAVVADLAEGASGNGDGEKKEKKE